MKTLKLLITLFALTFFNYSWSQWIVTPSTPITSFSQPNWKVDSDLNDSYMVMTYGNQNPSTSPGGTGTFLKVFDVNNNPITSDISVFGGGFHLSKVKISNANQIYVLGVHYAGGTVSNLVLKRYNTSGIFLGDTTVKVNIGGSMFDLEITDENDILVSFFDGNNIKVKSYSQTLSNKGTLVVANNITHQSPPNGSIRSQFLDYNSGKFIVGYSRGHLPGITSYIKKYTYNSVNVASSSLTNTYNFSGGFFRRHLESNNSHQIALRSNGDIFYVNAISGVKRITGTTTYSVSGRKKAKINVDKYDNFLLSWTDNSKARALLYSNTNSFIHYYQEDGNINGSWASAFYDCKFVIAGDKSNQGTNYHTNRKPHFQIFNCSDCDINSPSTADFNFRYPNQIVQMSSLYGPQDVAELCLVDRLWVDGTPSCNEDGYHVSLSEFNLGSWTDVNVLYSGWVCTGCTAPNNIDIVSFLPAGYQLRPNKIYRFSLSVGPVWSSKTKFFKIACCQRELVELEEEDVRIDKIKREGEEIQEEEIDEKEKTFLIFPNPSKDMITVDVSELYKASNSFGEISIEIRNISGTKVAGFSTTKIKKEIDISQFPNGVYVCHIKVGNENLSKKFIKTH